jgi:hypothetical protein
VKFVSYARKYAVSENFLSSRRTLDYYLLEFVAISTIHPINSPAQKVLYHAEKLETLDNEKNSRMEYELMTECFCDSR